MNIRVLSGIDVRQIHKNSLLLANFEDFNIKS